MTFFNPNDRILFDVMISAYADANLYEGEFIDMSKNIISFLKKEIVLTISGILAFISCFFVLPDSEYLNYIDSHTILILFCLMAVMEGFKQTGMFGRMAAALLQRVSSFRQLYMVLVFLCFFLPNIIFFSLKSL